MFKVMLTKKNLIMTGYLTILSILLSVLFLVGFFVFNWTLDPSLPGTLLGAIYLMIGWTVPNHYDYEERRRTKDVTAPLSKETKDKMNNFRAPLFLAALISIIIGLLSFLLALIIA